MKHKQQTLNSIEKALKILLAFDARRTSWGVRELSSQLGFSPATIQRILQTLKAYDFITQDEKTRQYSLGSIYYRFLNALQSNQPLSRAAVPFMEHLLALTQETVHLNVIDNDRRICIDMLESCPSEAAHPFMPEPPPNALSLFRAKNSLKNSCRQ